MKKISDIIAEQLKQQKIKYAFGIVGAGNVHIFDSITNLNYTQIICTHHEQAAIMAAIGYYRVTGNIASVILTTGAGSTNGTTGVLSAWMDSVPVLIIAGNENSKFTKVENQLRIWGVQGYDSVAMVEKITKYAARLVEPEQIMDYLNTAYNKALSDRCGPVWLEIPVNIQASVVDEHKISGSIENAPQNINPNIAKELNEIKQLIQSSSRPVLWLGNGIRLAGATDLVMQLVHKLNIPTLVSWAGMDLLAYDNELNFGSAGVYGQRSANFILQNADLIITIGSRLSILQTGHVLDEFARDAKLVMNDIDKKEIDKLGNKVTVAVNCSAKLFINELLNEVSIPKGSYPKWIEYCNNMKNKYSKIGKEHEDKNGFINSYKFINKLSSYLADDEIITTDMGTGLLSGHQAIDLRAKQRMFTSTGLGEMGYGLPAAVGAAIAANKRIICLNTDGGMMMNLQELQTTVYYKLPIKIFIFNNDGYLMIKHTQKALFNGRYSGTNPSSGVSCPDYKKIAAAFDFPYYDIKTWADVEAKIPEALNNSAACIIEVFMDPEQPLVPKLGVIITEDGSLVSPPLEDLSPLLPRDEFAKNMIIPVHQKSLIK